MKLNRALTSALLTTAALLIAAGAGIGQTPRPSPAAETSTTVNGKKITIKYSAPSMRGRKIFGAADALEPDNKVWRAGANEATALHTDAELTVGNLKIPAGDYTLFVWLDPKVWKLIVNKQTGQEGTDYHEDQDLGRVPMIMSKPPAPLETYKITVASAGGNKGTLRLEWENVIASVNFTAK